MLLFLWESAENVMEMYYCMNPTFLASSHIRNILLVGSRLLLTPQIIWVIEKYYWSKEFVLKEND